MESGSSAQPPQLDPLEPFPQNALEPGDIAVLVLYFLFVLAVGLWVRQAREGRQKSRRSPIIPEMREAKTSTRP